MSHRCLGHGPYPETLQVGGTFVSLQHPITQSDLNNSRDFSPAELHAILAYLDKEILTTSQQLHFISYEAIAVHENRCKSCEELKLHLGAHAPDTAPLPTVKDILELAVCEVRQRVRCVKIGNGQGSNIDRISLPDSLGEYMIFNPLVPEDIRSPLAGLDQEMHFRYIREMLKALTRRSLVTKLQRDYDEFSPLQTARTHSINALWSAYRDLFEEPIEAEVIKFVNQRKKDFIRSGQMSSGPSKGDKEFFMMPGKPGVGGLTLWRGVDDDHDAVAAKGLLNESNGAGSLRLSRAGSLHLLPQSAARSRRTTVSSWGGRSSPNVSLEQFPELTIPFDAIDQAIAEEILQTRTPSVRRGSNIASVKLRSKQPTPETSSYDLKRTIEETGGIKPPDEEDHKDAVETPSPRLSRNMSWWNADGSKTANEKASRPAFLRDRSVLTKPRPALKPEDRSKSEIRPSWLQKAKELFVKKKKDKKGKGRLSDMSTTSNTHLLQPVTAETAEDFLHPGGETAEGVHVPANTIAQPRATVADGTRHSGDTGSCQTQIPPPSRHPPRLPPPGFDSLLMLPESSPNAQARADKEKFDMEKTGKDDTAQPRPSTSEELAMTRAATAAARARTSPNKGAKRVRECHRLQDPSEKGFHALRQHPVERK